MIKQGVVVTEQHIAKLLALHLQNSLSHRNAQMSEAMKRELMKLVIHAYMVGYNECLDDFDVKTSKLDPDAEEIIMLTSRPEGRYDKYLCRDSIEKCVKAEEGVMITPIICKETWIKLSIMDLVMIRDNFMCRYCGQAGDTIDHVYPVSKGGKTTMENCVCACKKCNRAKGSNIIDIKEILPL